ncbi:hypothetical protein BH09PAT1_BH09PAT1_1470 [soil metagenome]
MRLDNSTEKGVLCSEYRPRVLIAQTCNENLNLLLNYAAKHNLFDVITAHTGKEVITEVNNQCFDAIILGLRFPDITGSTLAYLISQFDPLVSVAFLTEYSNDILVAGTIDLGLPFWSRIDKFKDLDKFCKEIYDFAMTMPCDNKTRIIRRQYTKPARERYLRYGKLVLPDSISTVLEQIKKRR